MTFYHTEETCQPSHRFQYDVFVSASVFGRSCTTLHEFARPKPSFQSETPKRCFSRSTVCCHLSEDFEFCLYGLGLVRRGWEAAPITAERGDILY
ncbi:MAG: hypothetical protein AAB363_04485 [Planctomycetota bacterium]|jgi:hypothetical protein